eukprot:TRINITY_DN73539_c0_g1_i1.p1 TRINITY_DN73539_c0_g1~~TRINITY_DN73539_c0_g1_i1.p1  ORF type:complete len:343 (+),score=41.08 TRINITY_DN73539_c0_g1_i1:39-1067(+)
MALVGDMHIPEAIFARQVIPRPRDSFMVLSYNLLCHSTRHLSHFNITKEQFPWEKRWLRFQQEFDIYDADVVCLQEVNKDMYKDLLEHFSAQGFQGHHIAKHLPEQDERFRWAEDTLGQAIFVRHSRFEIEASSAKLLRDATTQDEASADDQHALLNVINMRADGVICVALREVGSGHRVVIACAHPVYYFTPPGWASKTFQVHLTLRVVAEFASFCGIPSNAVVLCGDWNSQPCNGGYALITQGVLEPQHEEHPAANGWALPGLHSALEPLSSTYELMGAPPVLTTKTEGFTGALDHIFVGSALDVSAVLPLPDTKSLDNCPNEVWPSDHLAVGAFLTIRR